MTFEEFFLKKKIDLNKLKQADDGLYTQFKSHFTLMGEKSFDHTKKYWFNKLRKDFRLSEEEESRLKALYQKPLETAVKEEKTTEVEAVIAKPAGFKPKFKAATVAPKETEENTSSNPSTEETTIAKPAGFKPRFKAGATPVKSEETKAEQPIPTPETAESKSTTPVGFKPRFKAGATTIKTEETKTEEPISATKTEESKPAVGFKPRFKATKTPIQQEEIKEEPINLEPEKTIETLAQEDKPLGFKPRFKAKTTTIKQEGVNAEENIVADSQEEIKEEHTSAAKPLGFKPRFKQNK